MENRNLSDKPLNRNSRVSDQIAEYYKLYGQSRDLDKFMRLDSPEVTQRETLSIHMENRGEPLCAPTMPVFDDLLNDKETAPHCPGIEYGTPENKVQQIQTPESLFKAHRKLEWDSYGDVGYIPSESNSKSRPVHRSLLQEYFAEMTIPSSSMNANDTREPISFNLGPVACSTLSNNLNNEKCIQTSPPYSEEPQMGPYGSEDLGGTVTASSFESYSSTVNEHASDKQCDIQRVNQNKDGLFILSMEQRERFERLTGKKLIETHRANNFVDGQDNNQIDTNMSQPYSSKFEPISDVLLRQAISDGRYKRKINPINNRCYQDFKLMNQPPSKAPESGNLNNRENLINHSRFPAVSMEQQTCDTILQNIENHKNQQKNLSKTNQLTLNNDKRPIPEKINLPLRPCMKRTSTQTTHEQSEVRTTVSLIDSIEQEANTNRNRKRNENKKVHRSEVEQGIELLSSLIDAETVSHSRKKELIRDVIRKITHSSGSRIAGGYNSSDNETEKKFSIGLNTQEPQNTFLSLKELEANSSKLKKQISNDSSSGEGEKLIQINIYREFSNPIIPDGKTLCRENVNCIRESSYNKTDISTKSKFKLYENTENNDESITTKVKHNKVSGPKLSISTIAHKVESIEIEKPLDEAINKSTGKGAKLKRQENLKETELLEYEKQTKENKPESVVVSSSPGIGTQSSLLAEIDSFIEDIVFDNNFEIIKNNQRSTKSKQKTDDLTSTFFNPDCSKSPILSKRDFIKEKNKTTEAQAETKKLNSIRKVPAVPQNLKINTENCEEIDEAYANKPKLDYNHLHMEYESLSKPPTISRSSKPVSTKISDKDIFVETIVIENIGSENEIKEYVGQKSKSASLPSLESRNRFHTMDPVKSVNTYHQEHDRYVSGNESVDKKNDQKKYSAEYHAKTSDSALNIVKKTTTIITENSCSTISATDRESSPKHERKTNQKSNTFIKETSAMGVMSKQKIKQTPKVQEPSKNSIEILYTTEPREYCDSLTSNVSRNEYKEIEIEIKKTPYEGGSDERQTSEERDNVQNDPIDERKHDLGTSTQRYVNLLPKKKSRDAIDTIHNRQNVHEVDSDRTMYTVERSINKQPIDISKIKEIDQRPNASKYSNNLIKTQGLADSLPINRSKNIVEKEITDKIQSVHEHRTDSLRQLDGRLAPIPIIPSSPKRTIIEEEGIVKKHVLSEHRSQHKYRVNTGATGKAKVATEQEPVSRSGVYKQSSAKPSAASSVPRTSTALDKEKMSRSHRKPTYTSPIRKTTDKIDTRTFEKRRSKDDERKERNPVERKIVRPSSPRFDSQRMRSTSKSKPLPEHLTINEVARKSKVPSTSQSTRHLAQAQNEISTRREKLRSSNKRTSAGMQYFSDESINRSVNNESEDFSNRKQDIQQRTNSKEYGFSRQMTSEAVVATDEEAFTFSEPEEIYSRKASIETIRRRTTRDKRHIDHPTKSYDDKLNSEEYEDNEEDIHKIRCEIQNSKQKRTVSTKINNKPRQYTSKSRPSARTTTTIEADYEDISESEISVEHGAEIINSYSSRRTIKCRPSSKERNVRQSKLERQTTQRPTMSPTRRTSDKLHRINRATTHDEEIDRKFGHKKQAFTHLTAHSEQQASNKMKEGRLPQYDDVLDQGKTRNGQETQISRKSNRRHTSDKISSKILTANGTHTQRQQCPEQETSNMIRTKRGTECDNDIAQRITDNRRSTQHRTRYPSRHDESERVTEYDDHSSSSRVTQDPNTAPNRHKTDKNFVGKINAFNDNDHPRSTHIRKTSHTTSRTTFHNPQILEKLEEKRTVESDDTNNSMHRRTTHNNRETQRPTTISERHTYLTAGSESKAEKETDYSNGINKLMVPIEGSASYDRNIVSRSRTFDRAYKNPIDNRIETYVPTTIEEISEEISHTEIDADNVWERITMITRATERPSRIPPKRRTAYILKKKIIDYVPIVDEETDRPIADKKGNAANSNSVYSEPGISEEAKKTTEKPLLCDVKLGSIDAIQSQAKYTSKIKSISRPALEIDAEGSRNAATTSGRYKTYRVSKTSTETRNCSTQECNRRVKSTGADVKLDNDCDLIAMNEWLDPITESEFSYEMKKAEAKKKLDMLVNCKEREKQLSWIKTEISRLRNLRNILLDDNKISCNDVEDEQKEKDIYPKSIDDNKDSCTTYSGETSVSLSASSHSRVQLIIEKSDELYYKKKLGNYADSHERETKTDITNRDYSKRKNNLGFQNMRLKMDTPVLSNESGESVNLFAKQRKEKFIKLYRTQKEKNEIDRRDMEEKLKQARQKHTRHDEGITVTTCSGLQENSSLQLSSEQSVNQNIDQSNYYSSLRDKPDSQSNQWRDITIPHDPKIIIKSSSTEIFCCSSEISVPMGSSKSSSTTTHLYDEITCVGVGVQTNDSLKNTIPIFGPRSNILHECTQKVLNHPHKSTAIQVKPKGIAYVIEFEPWKDQSWKKSTDSCDQSKENQFSTDSLTLQEHLQRAHPIFLQQVKNRQKVLTKMQTIRHDRQIMLREIVENTSLTSMEIRLNDLPPPATELIRVFPTKQMKALNKRKVAVLPENIKKREADRIEKIKRGNRIIRDVFSRRLQKRVRSGQLSLNHSRTII